MYVAAGVTDIFVAYPVIGAQKWDRAAELASRCRPLVGVDSVTGVEGLARAATSPAVTRSTSAWSSTPGCTAPGRAPAS